MARIFAALVLALALGSTAHAQLFGLRHVWTVPGVMNTAYGLSTFIACTNSTTSNQIIGAEFYDGCCGNLTGSGSLSVAPDGTIILGPTNAIGIFVDVLINTGIMEKGHAKVKASTARGVLCSAFLADSMNDIPTGMVSLSVVKPSRQKGD
jgi:hypothetical protein